MKNDNSDNISDWTTRKLKREARMYDDIIHGQNSCYGSSDIQMLDVLTVELEKRGVEISTSINFKLT